VTSRRLHRIVGVAGSAFLLLAVITGLLWAYAPYLYWKPDYKQKKNVIPGPPVESARVSVKQAAALARERWPETTLIHSVTTRQDFGRLFVEVKGAAGKKESTLLIDAISGSVLAPLDLESAIASAKQYVPPAFTYVSSELQDPFITREGKPKGRAYLVRFRENGGTEIAIDADSGLILEEKDPSRAFHFWVMRLHRLEFFGTKKTLTMIPGAFLLTLILSGGWLWLRTRRRAGPERRRESD
jgi:uncharacterized iron-regulated membrane protein